MSIDLVGLLRGDLHGRGHTPPIPVAVLTMELQRGVMGDLASFPALREAAMEVDLVANAQTVVLAARALEIPVLHLTAEFRADRLGSSANTPLHAAVLRRADHLLSGTPAVEIIPELGPEPEDLVIPRFHGVSPFSGTSLDASLRNLGVHTLIVTGVSVNLGVLGLCIEAVNLGYQVVLVTDAVCGVPRHYADQVIEETLGLIATLSDSSQIVMSMTSACRAQDGSL